MKKFHDMKSSENLILANKKLLEKIFGREFLENELKKHNIVYKNENMKPTEYSFLDDIYIHRAAKWWELCDRLEKRDYKFELRFTTDIEEFADLLLFTYSVSLLLQNKVLDLNNNDIRGRLKDAEQFNSLYYELLVGANYLSNGYDVAFPEITGGRIDLHVEMKTRNIRAYVECKRLNYRALWNTTAKYLLKMLTEQNLNLSIQTKVKTPPKRDSEARRIVEPISGIINENGEKNRNEDLGVEIKELPDLITGKHFAEIIKNFENYDYFTWTCWTKPTKEGILIKNPKIVAFKDVRKFERAKRRLKDNLKDAYDKLEDVNSTYFKVICIDVSSIIGKIGVKIGEKSPKPEEIDFLTAEVKKWLLNHEDVAMVVLTWTKLYVDPLGIPAFLVIESHPIISEKCSCEITEVPTFSGWSIQIDMTIIPEPINARILINIGALLANNGFYAKALKYYSLAIKIDPKLKEAWNNMGRAFNELKKPKEALRCFKKALKIDRGYISAWINKGISYAMLKKFDVALECFDKAISINPSEPRAWYNKGLVLYFEGKFKDALKCANRALELNLEYKSAILLRDDCLKVLKNK